MAILKITPSGDSYIQQNAPSYKRGGSTIIDMMTVTGSNSFGLMEFEIPPIDGIIKSATLYCYKHYGSYLISLFRLTKKFVEPEVNWIQSANGVPWTTPGGDYDPAIIGQMKNAPMNWNIFPIDTGLITNNWAGFLFKTGARSQFVSKDATATSPFAGADGFKPYLEIVYESGLTVSDISLDIAEAQVNQAVTATVTVANLAATEKSGAVILKVADTVITSIPVTVTGNGTTTVNHQFSVDTSGTYPVCAGIEVAGAIPVFKCSNLKVLAGPDIAVAQVYTIPDALFDAGTYEIHGSITNRGDMPGSKDISVSVDGQVLQVVTVTLNPGETVDKSISATATRGTHNICADTVCISKSVLGSGTVNGYVYSSAGIPLQDVEININGVKVYTNAIGYFTAIVMEGTHVVTFTKSGYGQKSISITIAYGSTAFTEVSLEPIQTMGSVNITSYPEGAEIFLDGTDQQIKTPAILSNVPSGTHTYTLKLGNYNDYSGIVQVLENQTAQVSAMLVPAEGCIYFNVTPQGAKIFIDNVNTGLLTQSMVCGLSPGSHAYKLEKTGYQDAGGMITLVYGRGEVLEGTLVQKGAETGKLLGLSLLGAGVLGSVIYLARDQK